MWLRLEYRPAPLGIRKEQGRVAGQVLRNLVKVHEIPGSRRTLDPELLSVVGEVLEERPDDQDVDRDPDWTTPIGLPPNIPESDSPGT